MKSGPNLRTITITAMSRPALFRQMLETLAANDLKGWQIAIRVEPSPLAGAFSQIARETLGAANWNLDINSEVRGIRDNPFETMDHVFAGGSRLNIYLEEDLILAPDVTAMARWYERNHRPDWFCLSLLSGGCGSAGMLSDPSFPDLLFEAKTFNSLGFVMRAEEWQSLMRPAWHDELMCFCTPDGFPSHGWDWRAYSLVASTPNLVTVQPVLARSNHNGAEGHYCRPEFHSRAFEGLALHRGPAPDYKLVAKTELPRRIASHALLADEHARALLQLTRNSNRRHRLRRAVKRLFG